METFLLCLVFLLVTVAAMSIGLLKGLRVKGSCGGVTGECTVCGKNNAKKEGIKINGTLGKSIR